MSFVFNNQIKTNRIIDNKLLTLSTCWYVLKSKFNKDMYLSWIRNINSIVNNFNLVIYTNTESLTDIIQNIDVTNKKIKIIIKPIEEFYTYKYKEHWIKNNATSELELHKHIDWELNMLWNEKVFFVNETVKNRYFNTPYYGWCDIGYFRNRKDDLNTLYLQNWPNNLKLYENPFNDFYIHYGCVQNNTITYVKLSKDIKTHYVEHLKTPPTLQYEEICFAGGFFILKPQLINIYARLYEQKLLYYFLNNYIIKDDQSIIMDIIFTNPNIFYIHTENDRRFDNWFMFQRLLLYPKVTFL
jgi:hypothetical protein